MSSSDLSGADVAAAWGRVPDEMLRESVRAALAKKIRNALPQNMLPVDPVLEALIEACEKTCDCPRPGGPCAMLKYEPAGDY